MRGLKSAPWIAMLAVLGSCVDDSPSASVEGMYAPGPDCAYTTEDELVFRGGLDLSAFCDRPSYSAGLLVQNHLISRGSPTGNQLPLRANPNTLRITGAEVELQAQGGQLLPFEAFDERLVNPFSVATTAVIPSAEEDEPGQAFALVEVIPQAYVDAMREAVGPGDGGVIVASVKLFGETTGGVDVDVARFEFPISLCRGCRVVCREQLEGEGPESGDLEEAFDEACQNAPGVDGAFCVINSNIEQSCAQFE